MLIDAHSHLDKYGGELDAALEEMSQHRILTISVSMDLPSYQRNLEIAERCPLVIPTFGIHPWQAPEYADRLDELAEPTRQTPMIGEIGLDSDFVKDASEFPSQRKVLEYFLAAAKERHKIVNLHTKGAEEEIFQLLERYQTDRAIVHWYSGPFDILKSLADRGTYFTIGVEVLRSKRIQALAKAIPEHLLLTETDNPGGQQWLNGEFGMPSLVQKVIDKLAELKDKTPPETQELVMTNFSCLTIDDPWLQGTPFKAS